MSRKAQMVFFLVDVFSRLFCQPSAPAPPFLCPPLPIIHTLNARDISTLRTLDMVKATSARDEADRLAARLAHRDTGLEGLEAEADSLRAELTVARTGVMEREAVCSRAEAEVER